MHLVLSFLFTPMIVLYRFDIKLLASVIKYFFIIEVRGEKTKKIGDNNVLISLFWSFVKKSNENTLFIIVVEKKLICWDVIGNEEEKIGGVIGFILSSMNDWSLNKFL